MKQNKYLGLVIKYIFIINLFRYMNANIVFNKLGQS
jgi:hypothetical protein